MQSIKTKQHATAAPSGSAALKIPQSSQLAVELQLEATKKMVVFSTNIRGLAPAFLQETLLLKHLHTYQDQASVHQGEGS